MIQILGIAIVIVIICAIVFLLVHSAGSGNSVHTPPDEEGSAEKVPAVKDCTIYAPMAGELVELSQVPDAAFAEGLLGQGVAIQPVEGRLYSPIDGTVSSVFETKHAICLENEAGVELLIHIGLETVSLGGKYFEAKVKAEDRIQVGDLLIEFDLDEVSKDFKTVTPVLVTNTDSFASVTAVRTSGAIEVGEPLIKLKA